MHAKAGGFGKVQMAIGGTRAAAIGAANSMLLGAVLSIVATALIGWYWRPIREFRAD